MVDVLETLSKLPEQVFVPLNTDPCVVTALHRGIPGYTPVIRHNTAEAAQAQCNRLNDATITPAQIEAMQVGAMFGWHVPGADPDTYNT